MRRPYTFVFRSCTDTWLGRVAAAARFRRQRPRPWPGRARESLSARVRMHMPVQAKPHVHAVVCCGTLNKRQGGCSCAFLLRSLRTHERARAHTLPVLGSNVKKCTSSALNGLPVVW